ncbi:hypothetical protein SAMD00023353_1200170 [Rosellinia necatrix]|uniref:Cyanovirin-N domain-containing protein n=1 Tax=Rosellinia necatrix TaxID=77044 RepID=A0A1W2TLR3_ROSNE|nr:hypothetical protein SAMD00023353_1200170 [Rosellinia necatrix]
MRAIAPLTTIRDIVAVAALFPAAPGALAAASTTAGIHGGTNGAIYTLVNNCDNFIVYQDDLGAWLGGFCRATNGSRHHSALNLNHCIANNFGKMEARNDGNFAHTCNGMVVDGARSVLYATCSDGLSSEESAINLGDFIDNDNGRLLCFGHYGV